MSGTNVRIPWPLIRQNATNPGQLSGPYGVSNETGLRQHCTGAVFYVDPNYPGVVDRVHGTDPNWPMQTIAMALSKCEDYRGDVIMVMANDTWEYGERAEYNIPIQEAVEVTVHGVSIIGVSRSSALGVGWTPPVGGGPMITVSAMDCLIEGFCFMGRDVGGTAIYCEWNGTTLWGENLTVRNCFFDNEVDIGIQLEWSWNCRIHDNVFQTCDEYGIYVDPTGSGADLNLIYDNKFRDVITTAVSMENCDNNNIFQNQFFNDTAMGGGAAEDVFINTDGGDDNFVHHNTLSCLLPVPANGDYDDTCTAGDDAWVQNFCMDGPSVTNPT